MPPNMIGRLIMIKTNLIMKKIKGIAGEMVKTERRMISDGWTM